MRDSPQVAGIRIDKLDYRPEGRGISQHDSITATQTRNPSLTGSIFERAAESIAVKKSAVRQKQFAKYAGLFWAIINCLCAGSLATFSLYGHILQRRLGYSQYQLNGLSIAGELALYLPVPLSGYLCDRYGPAKPSLGAGVLSGTGYLVAALAYRNRWGYGYLVLGFVLVGTAASATYLSAVTCCVKNFRKGSRKGLTLALPIAAFGLSGMWLSQFATVALADSTPGARPGDIDVFRYFIFLGAILLVGGTVGGVLLRIVDEEDLIHEAVEDLATSGLLDDRSAAFRTRSRVPARGKSHGRNGRHGYGTIDHRPDERDDDGTMDERDDGTIDHRPDEPDDENGKPLDLATEKNMLLGEETRLFLADKTMWFLLVGFFFTAGPGEAYVNNVGTLLGTLESPLSLSSPFPSPDVQVSAATPATHVSIIAVASTLARIASGSLCDWLAPKATGRNTTSRAGRGRGSPHDDPEDRSAGGGADADADAGISRVAFLLSAALLTLSAQMLTASGIFDAHAEWFWTVSALLGAGYGATFSLTPIVISVVWGVENFGTNWGIVAVAPAAGATLWGLVYSAVYQAGPTRGHGGVGEGGVCHGPDCYRITFWAMAASTLVSCAFWLLAWRGPGGWRARGIAL